MGRGVANSRLPACCVIWRNGDNVLSFRDEILLLMLRRSGVLISQGNERFRAVSRDWMVLTPAGNAGIRGLRGERTSGRLSSRAV
jgi:hypothetical protein